ncbi:MAG: HupE/UreJ family protein, partial [Pseudomonadota bacterium]
MLSGIGHPILGFDHLVFIVAMGIVAIYTGRALTAPLEYIAGMLGGVALILSGVALPAVELVIALSLLVVGAILMSGRGLKLGTTMGLFALLGLFHGWAFGELLAGQEAGVGGGVIVGYLLGLAATQWLIAVGAGRAIQKIWGAVSADAIQSRLAGGIVAGVGAFLVLETGESAAFAALGLG